jgi:hypothetical protein
MKKFFLSALVASVAVSVALSADPLKAGPQKGEKVPGPFHPLNINGENAGEKACLYCRYGMSPVAMVFARSATPEIVTLAKKLEEQVKAHQDAEFNACIVFCSDDTSLKGQLEEIVKKEGLKNVTLAIDNPAGPKGYNIEKDADVVVLLYKDRKVISNHAYRKGEMCEDCVQKIIAEIPNVVKQ